MGKRTRLGSPLGVWLIDGGERTSDVCPVRPASDFSLYKDAHVVSQVRWLADLRQMWKPRVMVAPAAAALNYKISPWSHKGFEGQHAEIRSL